MEKRIRYEISNSLHRPSAILHRARTAHWTWYSPITFPLVPSQRKRSIVYLEWAKSPMRTNVHKGRCTSTQIHTRVHTVREVALDQLHFMRSILSLGWNLSMLHPCLYNRRHWRARFVAVASVTVLIRGRRSANISLQDRWQNRVERNFIVTTGARDALRRIA